MLQQNSLHKHANVPEPSVKTIQEQLDEHNKEPKALTWSPSSQSCDWNKPNPWRPHPETQQDPNAVLPDATRSTLKVMY